MTVTSGNSEDGGESTGETDRDSDESDDGERSSDAGFVSDEGDSS